MHLILLSGGSGKRLWPLSNDVRAKQFLKVLKNDSGQPESMVQRVYRQLSEVDIKWDSISIVAGESQLDQLELQLGKNVNIIIEPSRRDTFPAISLACSYLYSKENIQPDDVIAILPIDPYVEGDYFIEIAKIEEIMKNTDFNLVLLGSIPTFPSEKYGYIVPTYCSEGNSSEYNCSIVSYFKEKPNEQQATDLIKQGALWNCGVFGLKLDYVLDILNRDYGINNYNFSNIKDIFEQLKKTSFDYEVVEKADKIGVVKYAGKWKDLGTWETLTEEMNEKVSGNVIIDTLSNNTHVINELGIPVTVMGISDAVVVSTNDGILVGNKGETYRLKELISGINNRPMYESKRWGKYKVLEHIKKNEKPETIVKRLTINQGKQISYQFHNYRKEIWTIISGDGILILNGVKTKVSIGDSITIHEKDKHGIYALTDLEIIEVQLGTKLIEEDITRISMSWE